MTYRYGRLARDMERPALTLENYLTGAGLPPAPLVVDRASRVSSWPMYSNDTIGDCTCAAAGHIIQGWTAFNTPYPGYTEVTLPDSVILKGYEAVSGYNPVTGANDNGAQMQDVCKYWEQTGFAGHKLAGYAAFGDPTDLTLMRQVLNTFGTVYVGINCPQSAQEQFGQVWEWEPNSPIEGGHAICLQQVETDQVGVNHFVTWGALQKATDGFVEHYVEEAWCLVSQDWIGANGTSVEGLDLTQLLSDMEDV